MFWSSVYAIRRRLSSNGKQFLQPPSDDSNTMKPSSLYRSLALLICGLVFSAFVLGCGTNPLNSYVAQTGNPLVALYTLTPKSTGIVTISFGQTTNYGFNTASKSIVTGGQPISIYVAGMLQNTTYHMQATIKYGNGTTAIDLDHTFTTGNYPSGTFPHITAATTQGQTPQHGIEMLNPFLAPTKIMATDLAGNVIWAYQPPDNIGKANWFAPKLMPNGDILAIAAINPTDLATVTTPPGTANLVREFDLAGNTVKQITMAQLNAELAAANYHLTLGFFHHDATPLANGHWLVIANTIKSVTLTGATSPVNVSGDVIVDLDENLKPVWVWNEFDHLDVNRHPWNFPDWTHTNAVIYSHSDGNIIVSMRHQNWVVKVDYNNGSGTGNIIWHLGEGGDFKLVGGVDPTDWQYAQHGPNITTTNSSGIFGITMMDNGNDRQYPGGPVGATCGTNGAPACYSTVPIFQLSESTQTAEQTATLQFHAIYPGPLYNAFGGNSEMLANGNVELNLCALANGTSQVMEVTNQSNPQTVWTLNTAKYNFYRANRLPSLYPGVQW